MNPCLPKLAMPMYISPILPEQTQMFIWSWAFDGRCEIKSQFSYLKA